MIRGWNSLTDAQKLWVLLRDAGREGVHSHDLRAQGISGNPSQRAKDVTSKGQPVFTVREPRGKRPGSRYFLAAFAPDFAVPVAANGSERGGGPPTPPTAPSLRAVQAGTDAAEPGADSGAESKVMEKETRPRLTLVWDFTGEKSEERWEWQRAA